MLMVRRFALLALAMALISTLGLSGQSNAADSDPEVRFHDGHFEPTSFAVPANQPLQLKVVNSGDKPVEFESFELNRERVVPPGKSIRVYLPALSPGTYHFYDDLHEDGGQGTLVAR
jgi:cupredoxin-like protein